MNRSRYRLGSSRSSVWEKAAGAVAVCDGKALLILDLYGRWTFPKGHLEKGESWTDAAVREVREETAVEGTLGPRIGGIRYRMPNGHFKRVCFFLLVSENDEARRLPQEVEAAEFVPFADAKKRLLHQGYPGYARFLEAARAACGDVAARSKHKKRRRGAF